MKRQLFFRSAALSVVILLVFLLLWHAATLGSDHNGNTGTSNESAEYALLMGTAPSSASSVNDVNGMPTPLQFGKIALDQLSDPFYDNGPNDKGIGIQLLHSLGRVALGYLAAAIVAIPLGFAIGMSPVLYRALDPFIQVLKPISPLAWMPIALYTIKDASASAIFVIFICSVWPMLINTAFGVAGVRRDWLDVARTLEVSPLRKAFLVILPAAAPTIITGMRISMGIAWLVIVAAEMLIGGTGIGYFVWNEWNNLSLGNVIFAVLMIGVIGMLLDMAFAALQRKLTYVE